MMLKKHVPEKMFWGKHSRRFGLCCQSWPPRQRAASLDALVWYGRSPLFGSEGQGCTGCSTDPFSTGHPCIALLAWRQITGSNNSKSGVLELPVALRAFYDCPVILFFSCEIPKTHQKRIWSLCQSRAAIEHTGFISPDLGLVSCFFDSI